MTTTYFESTLGIEDAELCWKEAIESKQLQNIASLYCDKAVLMGALSPKVAYGKKEISSYFKLLKSLDQLSVHFFETRITKLGHAAINSGVYRFDFMENGEQKNFVARYTFVLEYKEASGQWLIVNHHSSLLPQKHSGLIS